MSDILSLLNIFFLHYQYIKNINLITDLPLTMLTDSIPISTLHFLKDHSKDSSKVSPIPVYYPYVK